MGKHRGTYRGGALEFDEPLNLPEAAVVDVEVSIATPADPFAIAEPAPAWAALTASRLHEMLRLPANWDSYGARPIELDYARSLWDLLTAILPADAPVPAIAPTVRGGVQAEWNVGGVDLEIEVVAPRQFSVLLEDSRNSEVVETAHGFTPGELTSYVKRLTGAATV